MKAKTIKIGKVTIPIEDYASQGNGVLGIRGSGKSYTSTYIAECLMDAGIPIIAIDPIGIWHNLKIKGAGKGYPVVVAGGEHADLPLTPETAPEIVRAAMLNNISLVLDLYDINLSKADWKKIVESCVRLLLYENKKHGLRHLFIEEGAEFAPQRVGPDQGRVFAEMEKLARMGGNSGLGFTLINQRSEEVSKSILELCDCLILHKQKGRNSLNSLEKWLDYSDGDGKEIAKTLPMLEQGECWIWSGGTAAPIRTKVPAKNSYHPDRKATRDQLAGAKAKAATVDVGSFVQTLQAALSEQIPKGKEKSDQKDNPAIEQLRMSLEKAHDDLIRANQQLQTERYRLQQLLNLLRESRQHQLSACDRLNAFLEAVHEPTDEADRLIASTIKQQQPSPLDQRANTTAIKAHDSPAKRKEPAPASEVSAKVRPGGEAYILASIIQISTGATREQITVMTGYKKTSRDTYISRLIAKDYVTINDQGLIAPTAAGRAALPAVKPLPVGKALRAYWLENLPPGEAEILRVLINAYPKPVLRSDMDKLTRFKKTSRDTYISRLSARLLIKDAGRGQVIASEVLF